MAVKRQENYFGLIQGNHLNKGFHPTRLKVNFIANKKYLYWQISN